MARIDAIVKIGNSFLEAAIQPYGFSSYTPYVTWDIVSHNEVSAWRITVINPYTEQTYTKQGSDGSSTTLSIPSSFVGLLEVFMEFSSDDTPNYSFDTDTFLFVVDSKKEIVYNQESPLFLWSNSSDPEADDISYNIEVSLDPSFESAPDLISSKFVAQQSGGNTSTQITCPLDQELFWRVRSYDGLSYSQFTPSHGFKSSSVFVPVVSIISVNVLNNEYRDVEITIDIEDLDSTAVSVFFYYLGGNATEKTSCSMINAVISVPVGESTFTWRSARNEQLVSADDYILYVSANDGDSTGIEVDYGTFSMDNSLIGGDTGGIGAIDTRFPASSIFVNLVYSDLDRPECDVHSGSYPDKLDSTERCRSETTLESHKIFAMTPITQSRSESTDGIELFKSFGHPGQAPAELALNFPHGVRMNPNTSTAGGTDLDYDDPIFTKRIDYVGPSGWHIPASDVDFSLGRYGFVKFNHIKYHDRDLCELCGGKGWRVEDLINIQDSLYERVPCPDCGGGRFSATKIQMSLYTVSEYEPIEDWVSPINMGANSLNPVYSGEFAELVSLTDDVITKSQMAELTYSDIEQEPLAKIDSLAEAKLYQDVEISDVTTSLIGEKTTYQPGFYPNQDSDFFNQRPTATHQWENGIFKITSSFDQVDEVQPLAVKYLQTGWDVRNMLHWSATSSKTSLIHIQVANLTEGDPYIDILSDEATFIDAAAAYMVQPRRFYAYWSSIANALQDGDQYRMRIRQYDPVTTNSSQWVYSSKFEVSQEIANPPVITGVVYDRWTKDIEITFSLHDTNNNNYDILGVYYNVNDGDFTRISIGDIKGSKYRLSSLDTENSHTITWETSAYGLTASDSYRIKIDAIRTSVIDSTTKPILTWSKSDNPVVQYAEVELISINGHFQYYVWNHDTESFETIEDGVFIPGEVDRLQFEIDEIEASPSPNGKYEYFTPQEKGGTLTDVTGYREWAATTYSPGITRNQVLLNKASELALLRDVEGPRLKQLKDDQERAVRKDLIDQGYYNNGFIENTPSNGVFRFRVESKPFGAFADEYDSRYEVYHQIELDPFDTFDSQDGEPLRSISYDPEQVRISGGTYAREDKIVQEDVETGQEAGVVNRENESTEYTWTSEENDSGKPWSGQSTVNNKGFVNYDSPTIDVDDVSTNLGTYTIPKSLFPGEVDSDVLPVGYTDWDNDYFWRISSYNVVNDVPKDSPTPAIDSYARNDDRIDIEYTVNGNSNISLCDISKAAYSIDDSTLIVHGEEEVLFHTDRPEGEESQDIDNPTVWIPYGLERSKPSCIKLDGNYYLWYYKDNSYNAGSIIHSRGTSHKDFGEYAMAIPQSINQKSLTDSLYVTGPEVVYNGTDYRMFFINQTTTTLDLMSASSDDLDIWEDVVEATGILADTSSCCVIYDDSTYKLWGCSGGEVYYYESVDGLSFTIQNSGNPVISEGYNIASPSCVLFDGSYHMVYTSFDLVEMSIEHVTSSDGISWSSKNSILQDSRYNPSISVDTYLGWESLRIYYNHNDTELKIKTAILSYEDWQEFDIAEVVNGQTVYLLKGDVLGVEDTGSCYIDLNMVEQELIDNADTARVGINLSNALSTFEYRVRSAWITAGETTEYEKDLSPDKFKYASDMLSIDFGGINE
jgi:hypothetical protein